MSYLKLDRTKINYISPKRTRSGIILSQVIPSECGPEKPKIISDTQELDIFFGRSFPEREYFEELLSGDVTLLLTNPKKSEFREIPVIDISKFSEVTEVSPGIPILHSYQLPEPPKNRDSEEYDKFLEEVSGKKYWASEESEYYVYYQDSWISESNLPVSILPGSTINHDTLRLNSKGWSDEKGFPWCWPKYSSSDWTPEYPESNVEGVKTTFESLLSTIHDTKDWSGKSVGFTLDFSGISGEKMKAPEENSQSYLVIPVSNGRMIQFYLGESGSLPPDTLGSTEDFNLEDEGTLKEQIEKILREISGYGWKYIQVDEEGLVYELFNEDICPDIEFYNIPGISFKGDTLVSHNILSVLSENHRRLEFYSQTLGHGDEDINIEITKIPGKTEWYRVIISRYGYQEVFEGPLYLEYSEDTEIYTCLEKMINLGSRLVTVKVYKTWTDEEGVIKDYIRENPGHGLPEGEFTLSRAIPDRSWEPEDFWSGLEELSEFGVSEDFLMIPRIEDYLKTGVKAGESWYSEYKDLHEYAAEKNCQVLISNNPYYFGCETYDTFENPTMGRPENPKEKHLYIINGISAEIWDGKKWIILATKDGGDRWKEIIETLSPGYTGNQIFNYQIKDDLGNVTKDLDPDNRLVYFYQDMTYLGWWRPAWYVFLRGLISGNYSPEVSDIIYDSPAKYYTEDTVSLGKYKSNFLSENGHIFYYRQIFSGDSPVTSVLSRFCMDKVSGTVSREFPKYLGKETTGEIIRGLQGILTGLRSRYSMIYSLEMSGMEENLEKQTLSIYLDLGIRETLDKDIKLSVTLNFNFT